MYCTTLKLIPHIYLNRLYNPKWNYNFGQLQSNMYPIIDLVSRYLYLYIPKRMVKDTVSFISIIKSYCKKDTSISLFSFISQYHQYSPVWGRQCWTCMLNVVVIIFHVIKEDLDLMNMEIQAYFLILFRSCLKSIHLVKESKTYTSRYFLGMFSRRFP